ncbi:MAG: hypothetical protein J6575_08635 [Bifidobacterium sp.]|nr:hypothetical protein [Bifidobacterium sp.]
MQDESRFQLMFPYAVHVPDSGVHVACGSTVDCDDSDCKLGCCILEVSEWVSEPGFTVEPLKEGAWTVEDVDEVSLGGVVGFVEASVSEGVAGPPETKPDVEPVVSEGVEESTELDVLLVSAEAEAAEECAELGVTLALFCASTD